jgi:hypothetical protein
VGGGECAGAEFAGGECAGAAWPGGEWPGGLGGPCPGGPWLCRVRVWSGLVAVVVPSGCRVRVQPHRWMAVRWWKVHRGTRLHSPHY